MRDDADERGASDGQMTGFARARGHSLIYVNPLDHH
jgi:hypothetical protein